MRNCYFCFQRWTLKIYDNNRSFCGRNKSDTRSKRERERVAVRTNQISVGMFAPKQPPREWGISNDEQLEIGRETRNGIIVEWKHKYEKVFAFADDGES